ncbi:MAG: ABC transporter permease subunit [Deltaproteobacteria bacterium]|nr:ABC transporter permease subunit [Deltaproteobacteria bacterium]
MKARFALFVVAVACVAALAFADDGLARVQRQQVLRWGGDVQGGEPYAYQDAHDSRHLIGFEVEIADALARRLGVKAEFVQNDWSTLIPSLERGDFDVAMNGLEVTAARRSRVAFSDPYYAFEETLVVRRDDSAVQGLDDLDDKRVGTLANSMAHEILRARRLEVVLYEGVEEPYIDLEGGRLAAVLLDNVIAERYGLVRPALRKAATAGSGVYAIALRRDEPELLTALNDALRDMRRSGELQAILTRWHLWDERQATATSLPTAASESAPALTATHLILFLRAAAATVFISSLAMLLAVIGGLGLSLLRRYGARSAQLAAQIYIEVFRGTPVLLQLYVLYYGLAPVLTLNAFTAAVLGLGLNYAAYEAELYRAGLDAVPVGQNEAALALGMSRRLALRRIILPQAVRIALPGVANDFIALLKDSSLVSVITVVELTKQMTITAVDLRSWLVPGALCAALYMALSFPLSRLARRLERRLSPVSR